MTATLQQFSRALLTPRLSMTSRADALVAANTSGLPRMRRFTRFAEAEIEWNERRWLVALPLTPSALLRLERTVSALKRLNTEYLAEFRILPDEMRWQDDYTGATHNADLILQLLPSEVDFEQALHTQTKETLLTALDALQNEMRRLQFTHNNLQAENLRWYAGRFIPIRYYDAQIGEPTEADTEAFDALRRKIAAADTVDEQVVSDITMSYHPINRLTGHRWVSSVFEGLVCVEDDAGYGFVDTDNNPVIASQFLWASDFHEGRAEVQTAEGMGLIDRQGCFVIPAEYEIIDYDYAASIIQVRHNGQWALFDYLGRRLTDFQDEKLKEPAEAMG